MSVAGRILEKYFGYDFDEFDEGGGSRQRKRERTPAWLKDEEMSESELPSNVRITNVNESLFEQLLLEYPDVAKNLIMEIREGYISEEEMHELVRQFLEFHGWHADEGLPGNVRVTVVDEAYKPASEMPLGLHKLHPKTWTKRGKEQAQRNILAKQKRGDRKILQGWGPDTHADKDVRKDNPTNGIWYKDGVEFTASPTVNSKNAEPNRVKRHAKSLIQKFTYPQKVRQVTDAASRRYDTQPGAYIGSLGHGGSTLWGKERAFKVNMAGVNQDDGKKIGYAMGLSQKVCKRQSRC